jgi:hypothetical protein
MKTVYADMTSILRVIVGEPGERLSIGRRDVVVSSEVLEVETQRAIDALRASGALNDAEFVACQRALRATLRDIHLFPLAREMIELAIATFPFRVNALHAIHIATAQVALRDAGPLEFWTHNPGLAAAATFRGFLVRGIPGLA